jgi:hypothetical protein
MTRIKGTNLDDLVMRVPLGDKIERVEIDYKWAYYELALLVTQIGSGEIAAMRAREFVVAISNAPRFFTQ